MFRGCLLQHWQMENRKILKKENFIERPITFETFIGVYFLVAIMWFVCMLTLIAEILTFRNIRRNKKPMKFFVLMENFIFGNKLIFIINK